MSKKKNENLSLLLFVAPALIVYFVFKLFPAISGIFYSMTDWNGLNKTYHFIGISNFIEIFHDINFWKSMLFTLKYVVIMVIVSNVTALLLAVTIESRRKAKGVFRTLFYMPNMISMIIGGYMWTFIFTKVCYYMADNWGLKFLDKSWIGDPKYSLIAIIIVSAWGSAGYLRLAHQPVTSPPTLKTGSASTGTSEYPGQISPVKPFFKSRRFLTAYIRFYFQRSF